MTNEEAIINNIKSWMDEGDGRFYFSNEDVNTIYNALDKQTPKKPYLNHDVSTIHINKGNQPHEWKRIESDNWHCPICNWFVAEHLVLPNGKEHIQRKKEYCDRCGQKIDWSEE